MHHEYTKPFKNDWGHFKYLYCWVYSQYILPSHGLRAYMYMLYMYIVETKRSLENAWTEEHQAAWRQAGNGEVCYRRTCLDDQSNIALNGTVYPSSTMQETPPIYWSKNCYTSRWQDSTCFWTVIWGPLLRCGTCQLRHYPTSLFCPPTDLSLMDSRPTCSHYMWF